MLSSNFVIKVANPYFPPKEQLKQPTENQIKTFTKYAVKKKTYPLFYDGCKQNHIALPPDADALMATYTLRRKKQVESAKLLAEIQEKTGVDLLFFKTFRPFNYISDDVDVLVRNSKDYDVLVKEIQKEGYFPLKVGTPEVSFRRLEKGTYVDLDIHKRLAVGSLDLFDVEALWQNHAYEELNLDGGCKMFKLSEDYEVVREAAYSMLKDFHLSIAGFYLGLNALLNRNLNTIKEIALKHNFSFHLNLYLGIVYSLAVQLYGAEAKERLRTALPVSANFLPLCRNLKAPYPYPVPIILWAYLSKASSEINRNKNLHVIPQILKQPSSKGVSVILNIIRDRLP